MKIAAIIVAYNFEPWITKCLGSLRQSEQAVDVIVVDNASQDRTVSIIQAQYPEVRLIANPRNIGFGRANNIGMRLALAEGYEAVFLMNQDAWVEPRTIGTLAAHFPATLRYGILSPVHLDGSGQELDKGFASYTWTGNLKALEEQTAHQLLVEAPFINAAFWFIPTHLLQEIGGFSPLYPHYGEDVDFVNRLHYRGYAVAYVPAARACHDRSNRRPGRKARSYSEYIYLLTEYANINRSLPAAFAYSVLAALKKAAISVWKADFLACRAYVGITWKLLCKSIEVWHYRHLNRERNGQAVYLQSDIAEETSNIPNHKTHSRPMTIQQPMYAPILLFVYNRPEHTRRLIESLLQNAEAAYSHLFVYSDNARNEEARPAVETVRRYIHGLEGFGKITVMERAENWGLARNIIDGVTEQVNRFGRVIVLEDDLIVAPHFLKFMNDALETYKDELRVGHIQACDFTQNDTLPPTFLIKWTGSWGWATWKRAWKLFNPDGKALLDELEHRRLTRRFDFDGAYRYTRMLRRQVEGKNNSWAIRWNASLFLADVLSLNVGHSLVQNMGFDSSGTHCGGGNLYASELWITPLPVSFIRPVEENNYARRCLARYYRRHFSFWARVARRIKRTLRGDFSR